MPLFETGKETREIQVAFAGVQVAPVPISAVLLSIKIFQVDVPNAVIGPEPVGVQRGLYLLVDSQKFSIQGNPAALILLNDALDHLQGRAANAGNCLYGQFESMRLRDIYALAKRGQVSFNVL